MSVFDSLTQVERAGQLAKPEGEMGVKGIEHAECHLENTPAVASTGLK